MSIILWRPEANDHAWEFPKPPPGLPGLEGALWSMANARCRKCGSQYCIKPAKSLDDVSRPEADCPVATDPELLAAQQAAFDEQG